MPKLVLAPLLVILTALIACSDPTPMPTETPVPTKAPEEMSTPTPPATQAESPTPDTTWEIISVRTGIHRAGTPTPPSEPTAVAISTPVPVIPPTPKQRPTEVAPAATATPSPFAILEVEIHRETPWRDLLDDLYPHERSCIEVEAGPDGLDMPVLADLEYVPDHEAAMFACLEPGTARAVLLGATVAILEEEEDDFEIPEEEVACIRNVLVEMDAAAVVAAMAHDAEDRLPAGKFMVGFYRCIPTAWVGPYDALNTPEDFEDRIDCVRKVLEGMDDAEIMVAVIWEKETREAEEFISALMDCILVDDRYGGTQDDHADRIGDATVVEVEHSLIAASDYESDVDFFAFVAEEGTTYQIGVGPGTLEVASISLYGPFPDYDEMYTADSYENGESGQITSIYWQSPYTDMFFVSVHGEGGTGDYSLFINVVNLPDDHADVRGKGTAIAVGQEASGELEFLGDVDAFRLDAEEGTVYEVTLDLGTLEEVVLDVEDIYGNLVVTEEADGGRNRYRATAVWKAEMTGFHYILVQGDGTGAYSLSARAWQDDHGDSSETATAMQVVEYAKSRIDTEKDVDYFVFEAREGASYIIESELGDLTFISLTLLDRRGEIASDDNYRRASQPTLIHWEAPADGEYWIAVEGRGPEREDSTGTYSIVVWSIVQPER